GRERSRTTPPSGNARRSGLAVPPVERINRVRASEAPRLIRLLAREPSASIRFEQAHTCRGAAGGIGDERQVLRLRGERMPPPQSGKPREVTVSCDQFAAVFD